VKSSIWRDRLVGEAGAHTESLGWRAAKPVFTRRPLGQHIDDVRLRREDPRFFLFFFLIDLRLISSKVSFSIDAEVGIFRCRKGPMLQPDRLIRPRRHCARGG